MNFLHDALAVLGSRHGLRIDPPRRRAGLLRAGRFENEPWFPLRAGLRLGGREVWLPLCPESETHGFTFVDQRTTPCTMVLIGIDAETGLKLRLTVAMPFRPGDADFSTAPVLILRLAVDALPGAYRWTNPTHRPTEVELLLEIGNGPLTVLPGSAPRTLRVSGFTHPVNLSPSGPDEWNEDPREVVLDERLLALEPDAATTAAGFRRSVCPADGRNSATLTVAWCGWLPPILEVAGSPTPFRYARTLPNVDAVTNWAAEHGTEIFTQAEAFDAAYADHELGPEWDKLLAQTLHSWLINTWWTRRPDGREWFSVWEGSCYFHSTVDVEFTQAPFYLSFWPELLKLQLDQWPDFLVPGEDILGPNATGTAYLAHDCGQHILADRCRYQHPMAVEETANYLILLCAHARRTGDYSLVERHATAWQKLVGFLAAADTDGDGVPDEGVANTLDDGSPAIQFGAVQTYLAVKTLAALECAVLLFTHLGQDSSAPRAQIARIRASLDAYAWNEDHFNVLLRRDGHMHNPWNGTDEHVAEIPGWDAAHIYTQNTFAVLDAVGIDLGIDPEKTRTDLRTAVARCLRRYGCIHTSHVPSTGEGLQLREGLAGASNDPGWISMNLVRDLAAFRRGIDFRHLAGRYWEWQLVTNTQGVHLFFETFNGNNLHHYPRGVAAWGVFDAVAGRRYMNGVESLDPAAGLPGVRVPAPTPSAPIPV